MTLTINEMPSHNHTYHRYSSSHNNPTVVRGSHRLAGGITGATGGGQSHNNLPPYVDMYYIIKVSRV